MPINAGYEFENAKKKFEEAKTPEAKLLALQEMYVTVPKHKGTENIRSDISKKIALMKHDIERKSDTVAKRGAGDTMAVKKEGAAQVCLVGLPNAGKSTVLKQLTNAEVEVSPYPFSTLKPLVGIMWFSGARVQLVEVPALIEGSAEGKANGPQILSVIRTADAVVLVLDGDNAVSEFEVLQRELKKAGIFLNAHRPRISIKPSSSSKGISLSGKQFLKLPQERLVEFLKQSGIHNADVVLEEEIRDLAQVFEALDERIVYKKALALLNFKGNSPRPVDGIRFPAFSFSNSAELELLRSELFALTDRVLIFTKKPGQKPDMRDPLVLPKGSKVEDLAQHLHKDLAQSLKHARLFGPNARFEGQRVQKDYVLQNNDILEIQA